MFTKDGREKGPLPVDKRHVEADQRLRVFPEPGGGLIEIKVGWGESTPGLILLLELQLTVEGMYVHIVVGREKERLFS
jgi:hypothetical protein